MRLARRNLGGVLSQGMKIARVPASQTVSGILTLKYMVLDKVFVQPRLRKGEPGGWRSIENTPAFALVTQREPNLIYTSVFTVGSVLSTLAHGTVNKLAPSQRPPEHAFGRWTNWIHASCVAKVIARCSQMQPPGKPVFPGAITDFDEAKIREWVDHVESGRWVCRDAPQLIDITIAQAEQVVGLRWQSNIQDLMATFNVKKKMLDPYDGDEELEIDKHRQLVWLTMSMLKIMHTRVQSGHNIPPEWRPKVEQTAGMWARRGRPRGSPKGRLLLPGSPTPVKSLIPGEEHLVVRNKPWTEK